jgi:hypothetical protein
MERTDDEGELSRRRLDIARFIEVYRWVNDNLPDEVGTAFDHFLDEPLVTHYPGDVIALYEALAADGDRGLRAMAATGLNHVMRIAPEEGVHLAARLLGDEDAGVAEQARETLRDLPGLLGPSGEDS